MSVSNKAKVIVTGGSGLLGKSLQDVESGYNFLSSKECNLENKDETQSYFDRIKPEKIVHLAAKVGGIKQNAEMHYDFISSNCKINSNVIDYAVKNNIPLIFSSSSCIFPNYSETRTYPMTEEDVFSGEPEGTNEGYAYSKRFAGKMLIAAKRQYGFNYTTLYFSNLYGEHDCFGKGDKSHLVTSVIEKFHKAKISGADVVKLMGTGSPMRQFMYAHDAASILNRIIQENIYGEYNVAIQNNMTIREIVDVVKNVVGYSGRLEYDGKLDGVYRKDVSSQKLIKVLGEFNFTDLETGVRNTYQKYLKSIV